jgi:microsomal epoxide hydrolase
MPLPFSILPHALKPPTPFTVSIPATQLTTLRTLLAHTKLPNPTYESLQSDGRFGVSHAWLAAAKERWENGFEWQRSEKWINSFPGFMSRVEVGEEEFDIHWTGLLSEREDAVPVLLLHGWPGLSLVTSVRARLSNGVTGSFLEFLPIMELMREEYTPQTLPYHLIATSMPGYAFSGHAPLDRELDLLEVPNILNQLMMDLGFGSGYVAQGGDIGSRVARILAVEHEACKGSPHLPFHLQCCKTKQKSAVHLNFCPAAQPPGSSLDSLSPLEKEGRLRAETFLDSGRGYSMMHATRPSTIGLILNSNPVALLAWMGEKFLEWSDVDPDLDMILEAVTLYWLTESGSRAIYTYRQVCVFCPSS